VDATAMLRRRNGPEARAIKNSAVRSPREIAKASGPGDRYELLIAAGWLPLPWGSALVHNRSDPKHREERVR